MCHCGHLKIFLATERDAAATATDILLPLLDTFQSLSVGGTSKGAIATTHPPRRQQRQGETQETHC